MMPSEPNNHESRLDRMERMMDLFLQDHARFDERQRKFEQRLEKSREEFEQEHKQLLKAQVVMYHHLEKLSGKVDKLSNSVDKLSDHVSGIDARLDRLAQAQLETDERINVLIRMMDEQIRRNPPPPTQ